MTFRPFDRHRQDHVLDRGRPSVRDPEHAGDRVAVDVGVQHADAAALGGQRGGEVHRDRGLADSALAGRDGDHRGQRAGLGERDLALGLAAAELVTELGPLLVAHHAQVDLDPGHSRHAADRGRDVAPQGVLQRAAGDGEQHPYAARRRRRRPRRSSTMPRSVIGRRISGSFTPASARRISDSSGWSCWRTCRPAYVPIQPALPIPAPLPETVDLGHRHRRVAVATRHFPERRASRRRGAVRGCRGLGGAGRRSAATARGPVPRRRRARGARSSPARRGWPAAPP